MRSCRVAWLSLVLASLAGAGCGDPVEPLATAAPGVVFAFPVDGQRDVPTGTRVVVSFSEPIDRAALGACTMTSGAFCLIGPTGVVNVTPEVSADGRAIWFPAGQLEAGADYDLMVRPALAPFAQNLPSSGPLVSFTTRSARPRAAAPTLVALDGGDPRSPESFRPLLETSTIRLVFSEPLDPRSVRFGAGSIELVDASGAAVPAAVFASGIHVSIDPTRDLMPGATYTLRLGSQVTDLGGQTLAPGSFLLTPRRTVTTPIPQLLRTRQAGEPGPEVSRSGAQTNEIVIDKPIIGRETSRLLPSVLSAELGDPKALDGPIAFTLRKGQRLKASNLDIALGGQIPVGLSSGDIWIELLTDAGGRIYRNPNQPADQRPENARAPLYVDLSLDVAVFASDREGNAVLTQTVLGVQGAGTAIATDGVLAIETVAALELGLLGVASAPTNMVLELVTDPSASRLVDTTAPSIVATYPAQSEEAVVDQGIDIVFDEPIDLARAQAGGIRLEAVSGGVIPSALELHGSSIVIRPVAPLPYGGLFRVVFPDVADVAGNKLAAPELTFTTPGLAGTGVAMTVAAVHPGAACALTAGTGASPGRCDGGKSSDDLYKPFSLPANDPIEVAFTQPVRGSSVTRGAVCGQGSVRIEELDGLGACVNPVAGTLMVRDRSIAFVPDVPWVDGKRYRMVLIAGGNDACDSGELCGPGGAASFDPLGGASDGGGAALAVDFVGAPPSAGTYMMTTVFPVADTNGSAALEGGERPRAENQAALRITGTSGGVSNASFDGPDCVPSTTSVENCMYLSGAMPVELGELSTSCGGVATSCIPVTLPAAAMYGTSTSLTATVFGIGIGTDTGMTVIRVREPAAGPLVGYVVDRAGTLTLVASLELYMDAPDMSVPLSSHDLHSKPLSVTLEGPMTFLPDGRIAIALANTADLPVVVNISNIALTGAVQMVVPAGEMKLQLVSPAPRGRAR